MTDLTPGAICWWQAGLTWFGSGWYMPSSPAEFLSREASMTSKLSTTQTVRNVFLFFPLLWRCGGAPWPACGTRGPRQLWQLSDTTGATKWSHTSMRWPDASTASRPWETTGSTWSGQPRLGFFTVSRRPCKQFLTGDNLLECAASVNGHTFNIRYKVTNLRAWVSICYYNISFYLVSPVL